MSKQLSFSETDIMNFCGEHAGKQVAKSGNDSSMMIMIIAVIIICCCIYGSLAIGFYYLYKKKSVNQETTA